MRTALPLIFLALMVGFCTDASATGTTTYISTLGQTPAGSGAVAQYGGQLDANASDFRTGGTAVSITSGTFSFANSDDISHVMTPSIYLDVGNKPGTLVGSFGTFSIAAAVTPGDFVFANYTVSSGGISLAANTTYWVVVKVDQATDLPFPVVWNTTSGQGVDVGSTFTTVSGTQVQYSSDGGSTWANANLGSGAGNALYSLSGSPVAVPEPATGCLLAGALGTLLLRRAKREAAE